MRIRDLSGQRFGSLIAQEISGKDSTGKTMWRCNCDCGASSRHTMLNLVNGTSKSCGCAKRRPSKRRLDLSKAKFGMLQPLSPVDGLRWDCACDCGSRTTARTVHLVRGHTRSCGCMSAQPDFKRRQQIATNNAKTAWSKLVRRQSASVCAACSSGSRLHAHHIVPFSMSASLAYDVENGVLLCIPCHRQVHRLIAANIGPGAALARVVADRSQHPEVSTLANLLAAGGIDDLRKAQHYLTKLIEISL